MIRQLATWIGFVVIGAAVGLASAWFMLSVAKPIASRLWDAYVDAYFWLRPLWTRARPCTRCGARVRPLDPEQLRPGDVRGFPQGDGSVLCRPCVQEASFRAFVQARTGAMSDR